MSRRCAFITVALMSACAAAPSARPGGNSAGARATISPAPLRSSQPGQAGRSSASAQAPAKTPQKANVQVVPVEPAAPAPEGLSLAILEPAPGQRIPEALAARAEIRIRVENWPTTENAEGVLVVLDGGRPRRLLAGAPLLLSALSSDGLVAPGPHSLFAVAVDARGRALQAQPQQGRQPFSIVDFAVGSENVELPKADATRLFCLSPHGTSYVNAASEQLLQIYALGARTTGSKGGDGRLPLRVASRKEQLNTSILLGQPHVVRGLPWGDISFSVADESSGARAHCRVTLNPEVSGK